MAQKTKAELQDEAKALGLDVAEDATVPQLKEAIKNAKAEGDAPDPAADDLKSQDDRDAALPSSELQDEARELGIEPSSYHTEQELQERVDHVRAEKEAVGVDPSISEARKGSNDNLNTADDEDAATTQANQ